MCMLGRGCIPMPIPHPCPYPTARSLWIYFANKEKVRVWPQAVSGSLLGLYSCSQYANSARHLISPSHSQPSSSPVLMTWLPIPHANHLPEAWWPEVTAGWWGDIRLLHPTLVAKGWTPPQTPTPEHSQCVHTKGNI